MSSSRSCCLGLLFVHKYSNLIFSAVIPFQEKDVDFQIFSLDEKRVLSIINETLRNKTSWSIIDVEETDFGYQVGHRAMKEHELTFYFDFWLFDDKYHGDKIRCTGRKRTGCQKWYNAVYRGKKSAPVFARRDYFPPVFQVFGTHRVPIRVESWKPSNTRVIWNIGTQLVVVTNEVRYECQKMSGIVPYFMINTLLSSRLGGMAWKS